MKMSIKIDRIASQMVKEISYVLANEVKDSDIRFVTVTDVKVTNDLSFAKVYVTVLREDKKVKVIGNNTVDISKYLGIDIDKEVIKEGAPEEVFSSLEFKNYFEEF